MKTNIPQSAPLDGHDTEDQTKWCRHTNPDICGSNGMTDICAFSRPDRICKKPPRSWKKIFEKLKNEAGE